MFSSLLVTASDLKDFAKEYDAPGLLPEIFRRLILASEATVTDLSFPSQESTAKGDWDGYVSSSGILPFLPAGPVGWELTTMTSGKGKKANEDYEKRVRALTAEERSAITYCAFNLHGYDEKSAWATEKASKNEWRDVRFLDNDDLEAWLESAPAVHIWLSRKRKKYPDGIMDVDSYWEDWSGSTIQRSDLN